MASLVAESLGILVAFSVVVASELRKFVLRRRAAAAGTPAEGTLAVPTAP